MTVVAEPILIKKEEKEYLQIVVKKLVVVPLTPNIYLCIFVLPSIYNRTSTPHIAHIAPIARLLYLSLPLLTPQGIKTVENEDHR
ncbi:hypothetical protein VNO80_23909 [Phaseolus coccineus]|uniref:Uncharacterized protein n=1 Tax=Phaseolus coccineus TaxID=3886 RepID=A0AAN9QKJ3_PHACN